MARATASLAAKFRTSPLAVLETVHTSTTIVEIKVRTHHILIFLGLLTVLVGRLIRALWRLVAHKDIQGGFLFGAVYPWCWCLYYWLYRGYTQQDLYLSSSSQLDIRPFVCMSFYA